jgi:O-antigen/teichoic acid export membrane protein
MEAPNPSSKTPLGIVRKFLRLIGVDAAIAITIMARGFTVAGSIVTVLLIARFLSPLQQGFYYTLWSMVALQVIFELGFTFVVLQMAAHERAHLELNEQGQFVGTRERLQRLASVLQKSLHWYAVAAVLMLLILTPGGYYFFRAHQPAGTPEPWRWPWIATVVASTLTFQMDPVYSFLEGCGQVKEVAKMRFGQSVAGTLMAWLAMVSGFGLFAPPMVMVGQVVVGTTFLSRRRRLLGPLFRLDTHDHAIRWTTEVWPFQWRIAISWLCAYLTSSVFTPIVFATRGPIEAGRMGMSLNICSSLAALAIAWMNTKAAPFGTMIARGERSRLDKLFFRTLWQSTGMLCAGIAAILGGLLILPYIAPRLASRMLSPGVFALLLGGFLATHIVQCLAIYLRSHKVEPFLIQSIVVAILASGGAYLLGRRWGSIGVGLGFMLSMAPIALTSAIVTFRSIRRRWSLV